jgi:replicative superfamily II helicase
MAVILIVLLIIDVLMAAGQTDDPRQKYTDKLAGTIVVRTDIQENVEEMKYVPPVPAPAAGTLGSEPSEEAAGAGEEEGLTAEERQAVTEYTELFEISEARALNLYNAGYKSKDDFKDAIVEDLIIVDKINPTIAKSIVQKMESD